MNSLNSQSQIASRCPCFAVPKSACNCHQKEAISQILESLRSALPWLENAYCLVRANNWEGNQEMQWPIDLADALHYCGEALSELEPENEGENNADT